jgi:hypothetical protein
MPVADKSDPPRHGRLIVVLGAGQLIVSFALLLWASTTPAPLPRWGGPIDGVIAFTLVGTLALLYQTAAKRVGLAELRASHRVATTLPAVIFILLWLSQHRLIWNVLLPGLAWRSFVLLSAIPLVMAVWRRPD